MTESRNPLCAVAWAEIFPWLKIARCPRFALSAGMIVIGMLGLIATHVGFVVISWVFSGVDNTALQERIIPQQTTAPWNWTAPLNLDSARYIEWPASVVRLTFEYAARMMHPFINLFSLDATFTHFLYALLCAAWELVVWSVCGAALTRSAALFLTREEKISPIAAIKFGFRRWTSYIGGPALPIICSFLIVIPLAMFGLIARSDFGAGIVAIAWPVVMIAGFLLAMLLVGLGFGWILMWPTISIEGTESFDAMSRSYSYTYHRPVRYFFYLIVAILCGMFTIAIVLLFAQATVYLGNWALSWGVGVERIETLNEPFVNGDALRFPKWAIHSWTNIITLIVIGYTASYFWTAATAIYLLLRKDEDGAEVEEIFIEPESDSFGLPPLKKDPAGVPVIDNDSTLPKSGM